MAVSVNIHFGAVSDSIRKQLKDQGVSASRDSVERWQKMTDGVTMLHIHGLIPDSIAHLARKKIIKLIAREGRTTE